MTPLKDKIRAAAIATPALTALLGTNPFRFFDTQLPQGSAFPAVVVQIISGGKSYALNTRLATGFSRVQFTIWSTNTAAGYASQAALEIALANFLDGLNLVGIAGLSQYSNIIVDTRDGFYAQTQPGNPLKQIDAMIFSNDSL
jgi:Protein of unknown function (DUF3168)